MSKTADKKYLIDIAKSIADQGIPNFPLSGKGPAIAKKDFTDAEGRGGCYAATTDHAILEKMYGKKKTGGEHRIGVPGGQLSGLVIVDCDLYKPEFDYDWYHSKTGTRWVR